MSGPAVIVPSLGAPTLDGCLAAVDDLDVQPMTTIVVLSGDGADRTLPEWTTAVRSRRRLGFAAAVNAGLAALPRPWPDVALLNDDAEPAPGWLTSLRDALVANPSLAAVQGTVLLEDGTVDGRGVVLDRYGLPVQADRNTPALPEPAEPRPLVAVSGTACLYRGEALEAAAWEDGTLLDPVFGSYHEDVDLGLRMARLGWGAAWVPGAATRHRGSLTGRRFAWRHPWWVLANRWQALAGNLTVDALAEFLPRLVRGELRAVRTLARENPRTLLVAPVVWWAVPWLVARGLHRRSPGPRLEIVPGGTP